MASMLINQSVDVHWLMPDHSPGGPAEEDKVVRVFNNLIPACEFAVAMAEEGNLQVTLHPASGDVLDITQARKIKIDWESGKTETEASEVEI